MHFQSQTIAKILFALPWFIQLPFMFVWAAQFIEWEMRSLNPFSRNTDTSLCFGIEETLSQKMSNCWRQPTYANARSRLLCDESMFAKQLNELSNRLIFLRWNRHAILIRAGSNYLYHVFQQSIFRCKKIVFHPPLRRCLKVQVQSKASYMCGIFTRHCNDICNRLATFLVSNLQLR